MAADRLLALVRHVTTDEHILAQCTDISALLLDEQGTRTASEYIAAYLDTCCSSSVESRDHGGRGADAGLESQAMTDGAKRGAEPAEERESCAMPSEESGGDSGFLTLPNGMRIRSLVDAETLFIYREIFEQRCYFRHGITPKPDWTVLDAGANIGLFTLSLRDVPGVHVYAFEPVPSVAKVLRNNLQLHGMQNQVNMR